MKQMSRYRGKAGQGERAFVPSSYPRRVNGENSCGPSTCSVPDARDRYDETEEEDLEAQMETRWCPAQAWQLGSGLGDLGDQDDLSRSGGLDDYRSCPSENEANK